MAEVEEKMETMGPMEPEEEDVPTFIEDLVFINNIPCYTDKHTIKGIKVFERIGWDDRVGATYLVELGGKELVMRVGTDKAAIVGIEGLFLNKIYFRPGPNLVDCLEFVPDHRFSLGTVARLGKDILKCLHSIHLLGYVSRCLNINLFHLCAASRHVFMADISNLRLDPTSFGHPSATWSGGSLLSPLRSHKGEGLARGDELESFLYLLVLLHTNELPWDSVYADQVESVKRESDVVANLGDSWSLLKEKIFAVGGQQIVDESVYEELFSILDEMAKEGGVKDEDDNYDFERDPTAEELPRFVLEKRPIEE